MIFSLVAEWPPFGEELLIRLTLRSLCIMSICYCVVSPHFGFECGTVALMAPVPGHCAYLYIITFARMFLCCVIVFASKLGFKLSPTKRETYSVTFSVQLTFLASSNFIHKIVTTCRFVTKLQYDIDEYPYVYLV